MHGCLGRLGAFQESYQRNRRLQLNSDLAPPANFLEGYKPFIAQLAGFFVIEDRVQRRCHALCAGAQVTHPLTSSWSPPANTVGILQAACAELLSSISCLHR